GVFGLEQAALALYSAWRLPGGESHRGRIIGELRRLARKQLNVPAATLVGALARELADEHLSALARPWLKQGEAGKAFVDVVEQRLKQSAAEAVAGLPEPQSQHAAAAGFTV